MSAAPVARPRGRPVLRMEDVRLAYGAHTVLTGVDWLIHAGERWFLLGPNGAGKTTLLRAILGLLPPRAGRIGRGPDRAHVGFVPQGCQIGRALPTTVREFVRLGLVGTGTPRAEAGGRLARALADVRLGELAAAPFASLSGGQRQRALVARALIRRPALLLLDEPTEGLDVPSEEAFLETLEALQRERGVTVLFVTHRLDLAAAHATHLALAFGGRLVCGTRDEVLAHPAAAEAFGRALARLAGGAPGRDPGARG